MPSLFWITSLLLCLTMAVGSQLAASGFQFDWSLTLSWLCLAAAIALTAWRWDRNIRLPRNWTWSFLAFSLGAAGLCVLLDMPWFANASVLLLFMAFWQGHRDRFTGGSLLSNWPAMLGFVGLPAAGGLALWQAYTPLFSKSLASALRYFEVPHSFYPTAIVFEDYELYFAEVALSVLSGLLFVAAAGVYSAAMRRTFLQSLMNVGLAFGSCALFQVGFHVSQAVLHHHLQQNFAEGPYWVALLLVWLTVVTLVFLSLERLLIGVFYPIRDAFLPDQANPFVYLWNKVNKAEPGGKSTAEPDEPQPGVLPDWALVTLAAVAMVGFAGATALGLNAVLFHSPGAVTQDPQVAWLSDELGMEHRKFQHLRATDHETLQVNVYSSLTPLLTEEVAVFGSPLSASAAVALAAGRGWETERAIDLDRNEDLNENQEHQPTTVFKFAYVDGTGKTVADNNGDLPGDSLVALHVIARFLRRPSEEQLAAFDQRFQQILSRITL